MLAAYEDLYELTEKFVAQIRLLERQKANKAKLFYHREANEVKY